MYHLKQSLSSKHNNGFTLIELVVAATIIAIVAAIAVPSYSRYATRVKRSEGKSTILDMANRLERYRVDKNGTYAGADVGNWLTNSKTENGYYAISLTENGTSYTLTATPQGVLASDDADCGKLTYNERGIKGISGSAAVDECW